MSSKNWPGHLIENGILFLYIRTNTQQRRAYGQSLRDDFRHGHPDRHGKRAGILPGYRERGLYLTSARYLDRNLAAPHRYSGSRATTKARLLALDLDPVRLAEANAHRIPVYTDEAKKKINPIKASKRGLKG